MPIATVLATIEPLVPRDNPTTILMHRPIFFICVDVLAGLGLIAGTDRVTLTVVPPGQAARPAVVDAVDTPDLPVPYPAAAYFAGRDPVLDAALTTSR